jgi:hypothetical protein
MFRKHLAALIAAVALFTATVVASVGTASTLAWLDAPAGQAIACSNGGHSGGGC